MKTERITHSLSSLIRWHLLFLHTGLGVAVFCAGVLFLTISSNSAGEIDFDTEVMPLLSKAGCNAAACHGSATGRGGFQLSLFGGDPDSDYDAIVRVLEGRRINFRAPRESLLIKKPSGELDHEGGVRFDPESPQARTLIDWISAGAARKKLRQLAALQVEPSKVVVQDLADVAWIRVTATFSDDSSRDFTDQVIFEPADPTSLTVDDRGQIRVRRRGRHTVVVRFLTHVTTVHVIVPFADAPLDLSRQPRGNWIDDELRSLWELLRIMPAASAADATLLRRVYLDLTGRLPTATQVREYLDNEEERKFEELVDRLLASEQFNEFWTHRLAKLLRIRATANDASSAKVFHDWLGQQVAGDRPWNQVAQQLLLAEGDSLRYGPANFYRLAGDAREQAEYVSETLMGVRLRCANCHNHPLDRWTQDDYHGLAAIFARIERGRVVRLASRGEVTNPRTGEAAVPRIPGGRYLHPSSDARGDLAVWLTARANPYFARATVNRIWQWLMGSGLVEPTDDLRPTNPAVHPQLLDRLADDFAAHDFRLRHTIGLIVNSASYRRAAAGPGSRPQFFSHAGSRPIDAEVLADAIADVTGVFERYGNHPPGTRAISLADPATPSATLDILGRCSRDTSCESAAPVSGGLAAKLHFVNGELINRKLVADEGRLHQLVQAGRSNQQIVTHFYLAALSRPPDDAELSYWSEQFEDGQPTAQRRQQLEDFVWSLLASREFRTN